MADTCPACGHQFVVERKPSAHATPDAPRRSRLAGAIDGIVDTHMTYVRNHDATGELSAMLAAALVRLHLCARDSSLATIAPPPFGLLMNADTLPDLIAAFPQLFPTPLIPSWLPPGWYPLLHDLCARVDASLTPEERAQFRLLQIKEKFGYLRLYIACPERMREWVADAERQSQGICMECGKPGKIVTVGALRATLCRQHEQEHGGDE